MKKIHGLTDAEREAYNNRDRAEVVILIALGFLLGVLFSTVFFL